MQIFIKNDDGTIFCQDCGGRGGFGATEAEHEPCPRCIAGQVGCDIPECGHAATVVVHGEIPFCAVHAIDDEAEMVAAEAARDLAEKNARAYRAGKISWNEAARS